MSNTISYKKIEVGHTEDHGYCIYVIGGNGQLIAPIDDIPMKDNNGDFNMIVEIPKECMKKMEVNINSVNQPLHYNIKNGKIRTVEYGGGYPANYGAIAQTLENENENDSRTGLVGDGDPIDVFDISDIAVTPGDIIQVKIIGAIAMIDHGATDWKIIGINVQDQLKDSYNELSDISETLLSKIIDFLENYKTLEGGNKNTFFSKQLWNSVEANDIINDTHVSWKNVYDMHKIPDENTL